MKRGIYFLKVFLMSMIILSFIQTCFALGVSPAKVDLNFQPGLESSIRFSVTAKQDMELEIYVSGDLAEYVELDKKKLVGGGTFIATIKLPEYIEKPGKHRILVGVKELIDPELLKSTIGTAVTIQTAIDIFVPYPGKYIEMSLKSHDVNIGEPVNFELTLVSKGTEEVTVTPRIEIFSKEGIVETLNFNERVIKSQESIGLKKTLETINYNPGNYEAMAIIVYDRIANATSKFRIGDLFINIVNHTRQIVVGGLRKFEIEIESGWNDKIDGAFGEVSIFNETGELVSFKTSSTSLIPWEKKTIEGFFDASDVAEGVYDTNITINYFGKDVGKSSSEIVKVEFVKESNAMIIGFIVGGVFVFLIIVGLLIKLLLKRKK